MIHVRLGCSEHRLLHRCPLRNLLINSMVYVSGRTSLCQRGKAMEVWSEGWRWRWRDGRRRRGWPNSHGSWLNMTAIKIKCWDLMCELRQDLLSRSSVWLCRGQTPSLIFFICCSFSLKPRLCFVDWLQVSICCIMCQNTAEKEKKTVVFVCVLQLFASLKDMDCFFSESVSILLLLLKPPLALNNTSRHAVRDQLTLKLLDFTLKAPVPQMSTEFCRQFC